MLHALLEDIVKFQGHESKDLLGAPVTQATTVYQMLRNFDSRKIVS